MLICIFARMYVLYICMYIFMYIYVRVLELLQVTMHTEHQTMSVNNSLKHISNFTIVLLSNFATSNRHSLHF